MTAAELPRLARGSAAMPDADGDLLARRDDDAFAELVRRHADMVFGTCRRVLGSATDADDAFQATFLVLHRKAETLAGRRCVAAWLYGVAFHTALKARAMATKRRAKEARARPVEPPERDAELLAALDAELAALPEKYRAPVVLCELEGVPRKAAAARLGIAEGTVSSRLATAHRMLEQRLRAKGFAAVLIGALLARAAPARAPYIPLPFGAAPSPTAAALALEVSKMLLLRKLKLGAALVAACVLALAAGSGALPRTAAEEPKASGRPAVRAPVPKPDEAKDEDRIQGLWQAVSLEAGGQKAPDEPTKEFRVRFKGDKITFVADNREHSFHLDPTAKPKAMAITAGDGKQKGVKLDCAIYELDGDTLRVCMDKEGEAGKRPTEFKTAPGDGLALLVLKRVKEEKAPQAQPNVPVPKAAGEWKEAKALELDGGRVTGVAFAPSGKTFAVARDNGKIDFFDPATRKHQQGMVLKHDPRVNANTELGTVAAVAFRPTPHPKLGDVFAVTHKNGVNFGSTAIGLLADNAAAVEGIPTNWAVKGFDPHQLMWAGDESLVATNGARTEWRWRLKGENDKLDFNWEPPGGARGRPTVLAALPDQSQFFLSNGTTLKDPNEVEVAAAPPLSSPQARLTGHKSRPTHAAVSKDGTRIVTGDEGGTLIVWEGKKFEFREKSRVGQGPGLAALALSPDGKTLAVLRTYSLAWLGEPANRSGAAFELFVFDATDPPAKPTAIWTTEARSLPGARTGPATLAFSPDGKTLLAAFADPYTADAELYGPIPKSLGVRVWERAAGK